MRREMRYFGLPEDAPLQRERRSVKRKMDDMMNATNELVDDAKRKGIAWAAASLLADVVKYMAVTGAVRVLVCTPGNCQRFGLDYESEMKKYSTSKGLTAYLKETYPLNWTQEFIDAMPESGLTIRLLAHVYNGQIRFER